MVTEGSEAFLKLKDTPPWGVTGGKQYRFYEYPRAFSVSRDPAEDTASLMGRIIMPWCTVAASRLYTTWEKEVAIHIMLMGRLRGLVSGAPLMEEESDIVEDVLNWVIRYALRVGGRLENVSNRVFRYLSRVGCELGLECGKWERAGVGQFAWPGYLNSSLGMRAVVGVILKNYNYIEGYEPPEYAGQFRYIPFVSKRNIYRVLRGFCLLGGDDVEDQVHFCQSKRMAAVDMVGWLMEEVELVGKLVQGEAFPGIRVMQEWLWVRGSRLPVGLSGKEVAVLLEQKGKMEAVMLAKVLGKVGDLGFDFSLQLEGLQRKRRWAERIIVSPNREELDKAMVVLRKDPLLLFLSGDATKGVLDPRVVAKRRDLLESWYQSGGGASWEGDCLGALVSLKSGSILVGEEVPSCGSQVVEFLDEGEEVVREIVGSELFRASFIERSRIGEILLLSGYRLDSVMEADKYLMGVLGTAKEVMRLSVVAERCRCKMEDL